MPVTTCYIEKTARATPEEIFAAARQLTGAAFKLFIYFDSFTELHFIYERAEVSKVLGLERHTLNRAFDDLCDTKYLVFKSKQACIFFTKSVENVPNES